MKPIEQAFLADILESPDDDAPRLIYADWLEENGQEERAEFIRVQCELAKIDAIEHDCGDDDEWRTTCPACGASCVAEELSRRERELFYADDAKTLRWFGLPQPWARIARIEPLLDGWKPDYPYVVIRRGFVEEVTLPLAGWLQYGPALVKLAPLRVARLSDYKPRRDGNAWFYPNNLLELLPETASFCPGTQWRHVTEADALTFMSHFCLEYAHGQNTKTLPP